MTNVGNVAMMSDQSLRDYLRANRTALEAVRITVDLHKRVEAEILAGIDTYVEEMRKRGLNVPTTG